MGHRDTAPAYQEYASDMLANRKFRLMTLEQRGLLYTIRLELWMSGSLPSDCEELSKILGFDPARIKESLPALVPHFFRDEAGQIVSPDLEDYRIKQNARRAAQADGAESARKKKEEKREMERAAASTAAANQTGNQTANQTSNQAGLRGEEQSGKAKSVFSEADISKTVVDADWTDDYEKAQASEHLIGARPQKVRP